jgi:hypothetical protein
MSKDGIYWYTDPGVIAQKFSVFSRHLPLTLGGITSEVLNEAAETMRSRVMGLGRIRTGDMFNSIGSDMQSTAGGRIRGHFGYINGEPYYTIFQEYGTRGRHGGMDRKVNPADLSGPTPGNGGIHAMHAFVDAAITLEIRLHDRIIETDIWRDLR